MDERSVRFINKVFDDILVNGIKPNIGEERVWSGHTFVKTPEGWKLISAKREVKPDTNKIDPYTYKGSDVLVNKFGVRSHTELNSIERMIWEDIKELIFEKDIKFTKQGLLDVHRVMFKNIYEWAGKTRNVNIHGGTAIFAPMNNINSSLDYLFNRVINPFLAILSDEKEEDRIVAGAVDIYSELIAIHPFRDGNGRSSRLFIDKILQKRKLGMNWSMMNMRQYYQASERMIMSANSNMMKDLFQTN
jgi:cell filamentation protein